eukprot:1609069-Prymnesium_polylepis.1
MALPRVSALAGVVLHLHRPGSSRSLRRSLRWSSLRAWRSICPTGTHSAAASGGAGSTARFTNLLSVLRPRSFPRPCGKGCGLPWYGRWPMLSPKA